LNRKYFGTDGIRGKAGEFPLDRDCVYNIGRAAGKVLGNRSGPALVGMDPRQSSGWISETLMSGLEKEGVKCVFSGVIPTPGVSWLCSKSRYSFGVVISASHNHYSDNGIKFFSNNGFKLSDEVEEEIEGQLSELLGTSAPNIPPAREPDNTCLERYVEGLFHLWRGPDISGTRVVLDCSNGAAYHAAPLLFEKLGAEVVSISCAPDGKNINENCGSLYPEAVSKKMKELRADIGFAFDGDADRCIAVTASGEVLDGDYILYWEAQRLKKGNNGRPVLVVGTIMSNLWLEQALEEEGIKFHRAAVGDRYVLKDLQERGGILGGEPSGHMLFLDRANTGDGLLTAINYAMLARDGGGLDAMKRGIKPYPQTIVNVQVKKRAPLTECSLIQQSLKQEERRLSGKGRIILRYSGTEPLIRLMVEADSHDTVQGVVDRLQPVLESELS